MVNTFEHPREVINQLVDDAYVRQETAAQARELSVSLNRNLNNVINEVPPEGRGIIADGIQNYREGISSGEIPLSAKTHEQARERLRTFFNVEKLDEQTRETVNEFINRWHQGGPEEYQFRQQQKDTGLGKIASLELTLSADTRRQEKSGITEPADLASIVEKALRDSVNQQEVQQ
ncbi:hypothetical protein A2619_03080 [candidate division WWE3 bacterium RIFOXYD1_FULL_39_9]|uniref:Uncharacterized protein n=1 Tax=candidate division WWE3 bacterium RIFOXYD1_FULL_39_9 TaxID=1802649 RepID=A0A1F4X8P9_UNCKA|nr:MAG: hypothetical protein A2619_03080 [candidate division WWE3 bacterium RIFOXYD1_FULL_39_9]